MFWNRSDQWDLHGSKLFWHSPWKLHRFGIWVLKRPGGGFELSVTFLGTFLSSRWRVQLPWGGVLGIQQFLSWWYVLSSIHTNSMRQGFPSEDSILRWCSVFTSPHLLAFFMLKLVGVRSRNNTTMMTLLWKMNSPSGNRTPVFRVTGGDTVHYTNEEGWETVGNCRI